MSLLLQALQKAARSREHGEADLSADALAKTDELAQESTTSLARGQYDAPAAATSAKAATLVNAGSVPGFDPLDYAREHYRLVFVSVVSLLAAGYGASVYVQVNRPFGSSAPAPASVVAAPAPQASVASTSPPPATAKISGMPGGAPASADSARASAGVRASEPAVAATEQAKPAAATAIFDKASARTRSAKDAGLVTPIWGAAAILRRQANSPPLADASNPIETVVIASSQSRPSRDISVRHEGAGVTAVSPTLMQAYEALQSGDNAPAKRLYEQVLQADPHNIDAWLGLGAIALSHSRIDDASRYYQQVLELEPRNSYAQAGLISIVGSADLPASESRLKQLIARDPSAFLYFSLGNLYAEQALWPSAQQAYFQAFQMQSDNPDYAFNLAIGLEHVSQNKLALVYYRKALDLSFKNGHANFDQSLVIQRVGQLSIGVEQ